MSVAVQSSMYSTVYSTSTVYSAQTCHCLSSHTCCMNICTVSSLCTQRSMTTRECCSYCTLAGIFGTLGQPLKLHSTEVRRFDVCTLTGREAGRPQNLHLPHPLIKSCWQLRLRPYHLFISRRDLVRRTIKLVPLFLSRWCEPTILACPPNVVARISRGTLMSNHGWLIRQPMDFKLTTQFVHARWVGTISDLILIDE